MQFKGASLHVAGKRQCSSLVVAVDLKPRSVTSDLVSMPECQVGPLRGSRAVFSIGAQAPWALS